MRDLLSPGPRSSRKSKQIPRFARNDNSTGCCNLNVVGTRDEPHLPPRSCRVMSQFCVFSLDPIALFCKSNRAPFLLETCHGAAQLFSNGGVRSQQTADTH